MNAKICPKRGTIITADDDRSFLANARDIDQLIFYLIVIIIR